MFTVDVKQQYNNNNNNSLVSKVSIKTENFALKTVTKHQSQSMSHNSVKQLLQSYRYIYIYTKYDDCSCYKLWDTDLNIQLNAIVNIA